MDLRGGNDSLIVPTKRAPKSLENKLLELNTMPWHSNTQGRLEPDGFKISGAVIGRFILLSDISLRIAIFSRNWSLW
jgi:hypothetical protein